ncbi:MAG: hypothetical protein K8R48_07630 [Alphaproteobacteria bacterium]|nr:hypothetical protein [Alphaproteobacteria bacterium]
MKERIKLIWLFIINFIGNEQVWRIFFHLYFFALLIEIFPPIKSAIFWLIPNHDPQLTVVTLALAFGTAVLAFYTAKLVMSGEKSARWQLRAYISALPTNCNYDVTKKKIQIQFEMHNTGKTPAHNVIQSNCVVIAPIQLDDIPLMTTFPEKTVIFPNTQKNGATSNEEITDVQISNIRNGSERVYLIADIQYNDVFEETHHTKVCAYIDVPGNIMADFLETGTGGPPCPFHYIDIHNDAD